ncbi:MAG: polyhydroxyalkanoic acid synthase [Burkholderiaceae bacterium]|nr:polyhydroxyalkanoic acid synthase [Burkholderiaceae bacterium]
MQPSSTNSPNERLDQRTRAALAQATLSLSPTSAAISAIDWASHLAQSPGKQLELAQLFTAQAALLARYVQASASKATSAPTAADQAVAPPLITDWRFTAPEWQTWPYNVMHQAYLLSEQWWHAATTQISGVSPHHQHLMEFFTREMLNLLSPRNHVFSNPEVLARTRQEAGLNLIRGLRNVAQDVADQAKLKPPQGAENFIVGKSMATTPGKVVCKTDLIELIQYRATTDKAHPEPILLVPAWIMKYYILDLTEQNSLVKYLVDQGYTVFCISWVNPDKEQQHMGMEDYLRLGVYAALDAVNTIVPKQQIHAVGYCLGGTLLSIAAASMARNNDQRLASMTLLAAQTDFTEPGELSLLIDESQVAQLEAQMADTGYLSGAQMLGAFQLLRSDQLLWTRIIQTYMMGERPELIELMAWNADATRMPARMHGQYLRQLFLNNDLAQGRYQVNDKAVALSNIRIPIFCLGTKADQIAPWRSVYKLHLLTPAEITFVLTSGGHNAGVISPPHRSHRHYQLLTRTPADHAYLSPDEWLEKAAHHAGSWWPAWAEWLKARSGAPTKRPRMGAPSLGYPATTAAPGDYIKVR